MSQWSCVCCELGLWVSGVGKRKKLPGHYCWVCGRRRPNERFSGSGHSRHVCRECAKLGAEELAYRQHVRDLERCITYEGFIARKRRVTFERFLRHEDPRIRAMAEERERVDAENRELARAQREADELAADAAGFEWTEDDEVPF